jgi:hypothetical protein
MSVLPTLPLISLTSRNPSRGGGLSRSLDLSSSVLSQRPPTNLADKFQTLAVRGDTSFRD